MATQLLYDEYTVITSGIAILKKRRRQPSTHCDREICLLLTIYETHYKTSVSKIPKTTFYSFRTWKVHYYKD